MSDDPLVLANRLTALGDIRAAAGVLEVALFSSAERFDIRQRLDEVVTQLPPEEALLFLERRRELGRLERPSIRKQLFIGLAAVAALVGAAAWALGPGAGVLVAGLALCVAVARMWFARAPLRWKGSEIRHDERPFSYHACSFALFVFSLMFLGGGLHATFGAVR